MAVVFSFRGQSLAAQRHVPLCWTPLSQKTTVRIPELLEVVLPMGRKNTPYPPPRYQPASPSGYIDLALSVDPPRGPFVHSSSERDHMLDRCFERAQHLRTQPQVVSVRTFEAVLVPPLKQIPRYDVVMLVRTTTPQATAHLATQLTDPTLGADLLMRANNPTRIGDTEEPAQGTYLFNHFLAPDPHTALQGWKSVAGWYTTKVGMDNSTPLHPVDQAPFALVNYARLPGRALPFLAGQLVRPSFHRFVRARLAQHQMVALPVLYRPV